jgi:hypothetical protein
MATTGAGLASTAITAGRALLRQEPAPDGRRRAPDRDRLPARRPAPAELSNQAMPGAAGTIRPDQPSPHPGLVITGGHDDVP